MAKYGKDTAEGCFRCASQKGFIAASWMRNLAKSKALSSLKMEDRAL